MLATARVGLPIACDSAPAVADGFRVRPMMASWCHAEDGFGGCRSFLFCEQGKWTEDHFVSGDSWWQIVTGDIWWHWRSNRVRRI